MNYKKNSICIIISLVTCLLIVAAFNYIVDPAGLFRTTKYEYGIAKILLKGKNVANLSDYNERLLQKYLIENIKLKPETVVLGSSRSLLIAPLQKSKSLFLNNSVSGATLEDIIAIYGFYNHKNIKPKTIILSIDPWMLNQNNGQVRWQSLQIEYKNELHNLNIESNDLNFGFFNSYEIKKLKELVSMPYFLASYEKLKNMHKEKESEKSKYYETDFDCLKVSVKRANGTTCYPIEFREASLDKINKEAKTYANVESIYSLGDFKTLSNTEMLEKLINEMLKQKTHIVIFLSPYHPYVYSVMQNNAKYKQVFESENYLKTLAKSKNIKIIGSYNPAKLNLQAQDFYDGMHLQEKAVRKINILQY